MRVQYYNWSGITLQHGNILVGFDLYGETVTWNDLQEAKTIILCLTHGHPEHAGSLRSFLEAPEARPYLKSIHLISSPEVIRYINARGILAQHQVHAVGDGEYITIDGVKITSFSWVHMPLLPPGIRHKIEYILQLMIHPLDLFRIGILGLRLPMNAPQLGFHLIYPDGTTVLNYAEGVHRLTDAREVERVAEKLPAQMLFFAVEPDDAKVIPLWVRMLAPREVYLYEAHRPWRDLFHLPYIDLNNYADELSKRFETMNFVALTSPGQVSAKEI